MLDPCNLDFDKLGFHAGLEVHHQIKSKRKLFCYCPPKLIPSTTTPDYRFERYFRPVLGEMGDYDPGMLIEFEKGYRCIYHAFEACDCIYEQDEQPPFWPDMETIKNAYKLAHWFDMSALVDEIIFARKQYLDGSITTGFQRTAIVGRDGYAIIDGQKIRITNLTVEEDAARRFRTENFGRTIYYNLDRLGVPLVEVITEHNDVNEPHTLVKLAHMIGLTLRLSDIGRRGIGAVRQDVNISIKGGDRVELKGVQDLSLLEKWCRHETVRQDALITIQKNLQELEIKKEDFEHTYVDLTDLFRDIPKNFVIMGVRLPKIEKLTQKEIQPGKDFGLDIMEKACLISGVPLQNMYFSHESQDDVCRKRKEYIIKQDNENYFFPLITLEMDKQIRERLQLDTNDGYFLAIHIQKWVIHAMKKIIERIKMAFDGVPQETRRATLDGNSEFLRVIHGKERLYPDTDTPVIDMDMIEIAELKKDVKEKPWELEKKFSNDYRLNFNQLERLIRHNHFEVFEWLVQEKKLDPKVCFYFLENTLISLRREGFSVQVLGKEEIFTILNLFQQKKWDFQIIPAFCRHYLSEDNPTIEEIISKLNIDEYTDEDIYNLYNEASSWYEQEYQKQNIDYNHKIDKITGFMMKEIKGSISGKYIKDYVEKLSHKEESR